MNESACVRILLSERLCDSKLNPSILIQGPSMLCCAVLLCCVSLFATTWTVAHQAPLSTGILQARILIRDRALISCTGQ